MSNNSIKIIDITEIEDKMEWQRKYTLLHPKKTFTSEWVEDRLLFHEVDKEKKDVTLFAYRTCICSYLIDGKVSIMSGPSIYEGDRRKIWKNLKKKGQGGDFILGSHGKINGKDVIQFTLAKWKILDIVKHGGFSSDGERKIRMRELELKMSETKKTATEFQEAETEWNKLAKR